VAWWRQLVTGALGTIAVALRLAIVAGALLLISPACRRIARGVPGSMTGFLASAAVGAAWLALGPEMHATGQPIGPGLYSMFYRWVPGFNGLRVPALNFAIVALCLAVLAGIGAARLLSRVSSAVSGVQF
jgi:hypothetical protein